MKILEAKLQNHSMPIKAPNSLREIKKRKIFAQYNKPIHSAKSCDAAWTSILHYSVFNRHPQGRTTKQKHSSDCVNRDVVAKVWFSEGLFPLWLLKDQFPFYASARIMKPLPLRVRGNTNSAIQLCRCESSLARWAVVTDSRIPRLAPYLEERSGNIPRSRLRTLTSNWTLNFLYQQIFRTRSPSCCGRELPVTVVNCQSIWMVASVNFLLPNLSSPVFPHLQSERTSLRREAAVWSSQLDLKCQPASTSRACEWIHSTVFFSCFFSRKRRERRAPQPSKLLKLSQKHNAMKTELPLTHHTHTQTP